VVHDISRARALMTQPNAKASRTRAPLRCLEKVWNWPPSLVSSSMAVQPLL